MTGRQRGVLAATGLGLFMVFLDAMIANLALPDIQKEFGGGESTLQWIVIAYSIGMALFIMPSGAIADRRGRRLVFIVSAVVFSLASMTAGLAPEMWVLVAARGIQGLGGAALSVTSLALVSAEFKDADIKARAIGIWTGIAAAGIALGPTLGGFLTEDVSWRAVFLINLPVGVVVVLLSLKYLAESRDPVERALDPVGQLLFMIAIVSLSVGVVMGPQEGWTSPLIIGCFVSFVVSITLFIPYEYRRHDPMLDVRLFLNSTYSWTIASVFALYFLIYGALLMVTQYWQNIRDFSPIEAGLLMLPFAIVMMLLPPQTGKRTAKVGATKQATRGLIIIFLGAIALIMSLHLSLLASAAFVIMAVGVALANPSLTTLSMSTAPADRAGMASGILSAQRAVGSTLGYAVMGSLLAAWLGATLSGSLATAIPDSSQREAVSEAIIESANPYAYASEIGPGEPIPHESAQTDDEILEASKGDFVSGMQISLALGALLIFIMWLMGRLRYARPPDEVEVDIHVDLGEDAGGVDVEVEVRSDVNAIVDVGAEVDVDRD